MHRIVVFFDNREPVARALLRGVIDAVAARSDARIVALCPYRTPGFLNGLAAWLGTGLSRILQRAMDPALPRHRWGPAPVSLGGMARRTGAEVIRPSWTPQGVEELSGRLERLAPGFAINMYTPRRFPPRLLAVFRSIINYHNGALPGYRGAKATHWSVYLRERTSGWVVHHMTHELDAGNILAAGAVPVGERSGIRELEWAKAEQALVELPAWLERWFGGDPGIPQAGAARLFTLADYDVITRVESPPQLTSEEWLWRIRCFSRVFARVDGATLPVTRLIPVKRLGRGMIGWRCADDVCLRVTRADFLPLAISGAGRGRASQARRRAGPAPRGD